MRRLGLFLLIIPITLFVACGGGDSSSTKTVTLTPPTLSISPTSVSITSITTTFTVTAAGNPSPAGTCSVPSGQGSITLSGNTVTYTVPSTITLPASVTLTCTASNLAGTATATAAITIPVPAVNAVSVSPATSTISSGTTKQFTVSVTGAGLFDPSVRWSVNGIPGGNLTVGTITSAGVYSAPYIFATPVSVTATSSVDLTKSGSASVNLARSTPVGAWQRVGPEGAFIWALAADPAKPSTIYASSAVGALWKSTDSGSTWNLLTFSNPELSSAQVSVLRVSAAGTVYAGTNRPAPLYKSTDGGSTWVSLPWGQTSTQIVDLDFDSTAQTFYAATLAGLFKSTDAGSTWAQVSTLPSGATFGVNSIVRLDAGSPQRVYVGTKGGLFYSEDGSATWTQTTTSSLEPDVRGLFIDPADPTKLVALTFVSGSVIGDVFRSTDRAASWTHSTISGTSLNLLIAPSGNPTIAADPANSSTLYVEQSQSPAVLKSTDGGATWIGAGAGLPTAQSGGLIATPAGLLGSFGLEGLWRSTDAAVTWSSSNSGMRGTSLYSLAIDDSSTPAAIFAATVGPLKRSLDGGSTWTDSLLPTWQDDAGIWAVAIDPANRDHVFAGSYQSHNNGGPVLFESTDRGSNWTARKQLASTPILDIVFQPTAAKHLFLCLQGGQSVMRSIDNGLTWSTSSSGLPLNASAREIVPDPVDPNVLYLAADSGVYKSVDSGLTWTAKTTAANIQEIALDTRHAGFMYAAGGSGQTPVWLKSTDAGETWSSLTVASPGAGFGYLVIDPDWPDSIFISATFGAVQWSGDGGSTWTPLITNFGAPIIVGGSAVGGGPVLLIPNTHPRRLYVTTINAGILSFDLAP